MLEVWPRGVAQAPTPMLQIVTNVEIREASVEVIQVCLGSGVILENQARGVSPPMDEQLTSKAILEHSREVTQVPVEGEAT